MGRYLAPLLGCLSLLAAVAAPAQTSCSASFCLRQTTLDAGGAAGASAGYASTGSLGQEVAVGTSSSPQYVLQSGFWSFCGSGLVPVVLLVTKNSSDPELPDLSWSGNNPPYVVYRDLDPSQVYGSPLTSTSAKAYTDAAPPSAAVVFYGVLATAPGFVFQETLPPSQREAAPPAPGVPEK